MLEFRYSYFPSEGWKVNTKNSIPVCELRSFEKYLEMSPCYFPHNAFYLRLEDVVYVVRRRNEGSR